MFGGIPSTSHFWHTLYNNVLQVILENAFVIKLHRPFSIDLILMVLIQPYHPKTHGTDTNSECVIILVSGIASLALMLGHRSFYNTTCLTISIVSIVQLLACWFIHAFIYGCCLKSAQHDQLQLCQYKRMRYRTNAKASSEPVFQLCYKVYR